MSIIKNFNPPRSMPCSRICPPGGDVLRDVASSARDLNSDLLPVAMHPRSDANHAVRLWLHGASWHLAQSLVFWQFKVCIPHISQAVREASRRPSSLVQRVASAKGREEAAFAAASLMSASICRNLSQKVK